MKVLYINKADKERALKVKTCCVMSGIQIAAADEAQLAELPADAELMKLIEMNGKQVQDFLAALRRFGVRVDLKCVETDYNRDWPLAKLYAELQEEHAHMKELEAARKAQG